MPFEDSTPDSTDFQPIPAMLAASPPLLAAQGFFNSKDLQEILFWGGVLVFSMLGLFVVQKVIRHAIQSRVRSIHLRAGIHPEDLDRMTRTGLLSEDERKRVQQAIARNLSREAREALQAELRRKAEFERRSKAVSPEAIRKAIEEENVRPPGSPVVPPASPGGLSPAAPPVPRVPPRGPATPGPLEQPRPSVDLDTLLSRGLITREDYDRLRQQDDGEGS